MPKVSEEYIKKKKKEIIEAAYRVCKRKPVASVDMKDIIEEAGFSHGVIYRYYKDLDEVLRDMVYSLNSENRIDEKLDKILTGGTDQWEKKIVSVCALLADQMTSVGVDIMKISLYCDTLAMSDPTRASAIAAKLGSDGQSPLLYLVASMSAFLEEVKKEKKLHPSRPVEEILQFMIVTFQGVQTGYVMSHCFASDQVRGTYEPDVMFRCLADAMVRMMKGDKA
ncbi:MAG: helix-turn-helix transcriptional regulator [Clostridiales bacterium]|nr:helix-turn-helix transcriptional regulator [Clostridiales bacterium]